VTAYLALCGGVLLACVVALVALIYLAPVDNSQDEP
jgi:hypothetical protein